MAQVLEALGKDVRIVNGQPTPPNLAFIDPTNRIRTIHRETKLDELDDVEVLMILDTSAWAQLGPMGEVIRETKAKKIVVDHHVSEDDLGAEPFKNTTAEATGRLVVEAAEQLGVELTAEMATPIYAAIATDTGWYRFNSTTSYTYQVAAKLVDAGANPSWIFRELYERNTLGRLKLRGEVLARIELDLAGRLAHTFILKDDFERLGALPSDTEDLVNMALEIDGTEVAVIMVEQLGGGFKLSFRSRSDVDCSKVAANFGGGGHKAAAGAFIKGSFDVIQPQVLDVVRDAMR
jgi:phosphoesterase RecJ-like protein